VEFNLDFRTTAAGIHVNGSTVAGNEYDHVPGNNALAWTTTVP
jgi:hypothetical protein